MEERKKIQQKRKIIRIIITIAALLFCLFLGYIMIRFAANKEYFNYWMDSHGIFGKVLYCLMVIFQIIVAIIPGEPLEIAGGYAFGVWWGTILYLVSATLGGMCVFALVRRYGDGIMEMFFSKEKIGELKCLQVTKSIDKGKKERLLFVLFILPGTPKDLLCYFAGMTRVSPLAWLLVCSFGRLPSLLTSTIGGSAIGTNNLKGALWAFGIAAVISIFGILIYRFIKKREHREPGKKDENIDSK